MIITKIERQKKNERRFSVFIDEAFAFGLDGADVNYYGLTEGMELDDNKLEFIMNEKVFIEARDMAANFLAYRARSRKEVSDKLLESGFSPDITERALALMEKYSYIDDEKFCAMFIKDKVNLNGIGSVRLRYELRQKGVDSEIIEKCLAELEYDEYDRAYDVLCKRYKRGFCNGIDDKTAIKKEMKRALDFLIRKGYPFDAANEAVQRLVNP